MRPSTEKIITAFGKAPGKERKSERFAQPPARSMRSGGSSSSPASVGPQTVQQQLEWRVRQYGVRYTAQLGLSPYWHEEIARRLNAYFVAGLVRERMGRGDVAVS